MGLQLFTVFIDKTTWLFRVLASQSSRQLHLFLPDTEHGIIDAKISLFQQSKFCIYCTDDNSMNNMEDTFNYPMFVSVPSETSFLIYLL